VKNPAVLVAHQTIATQDVAQLVGEAYNAGVNDLVIIASDFKADFIDKVLLTDDDINIICVKAPGFGENRIELMKDIAAFVGTEVVGAKLPKKVSQLKPTDLGNCEELVSTLNETVITGGKDITSYVADLKAKLEQAKTDFDKDKIEKRIAQLRAQVGYIRVGGNTEMEAEERKYLVDDAVAATEAALKDGIVPGGGTTYIEIAKRLEELSDGHTLLKEALYAPFKVLMTNAGERYGVKLEELTEFGKGFDVMGSGELVDLKEHGVIDPVLVIRQTITNATSVAGSALTTGVIITRETDDKEKDDE
jgi:chaperonin GroEL